MAITGKPVAREHDVHWSNRTGPEGGRLRTVSFIRCVDASASWDDPANLVTLVRYHDDGPFAGRACLRNHPDGTATWNQYVEQPDGALLSTTSEGVHDDSLQPAALLDGTRVETLHNAAGALVRREVFAVTPAGELLVDAAYGGDFDAFGRPHIMLYPDGSHTETAYACCGPSRTIDRAGNQTLYTYDDLGRLESRLDYAGSAWPELTRHVLDGAGRVIETWRGPDQDSLQLISQAAYNPAGEQTWRRERWLDDDPTPARQTTFSSVQDDAGFVTTTTTLAGGATIVERVWRDGTPRETTGTAVHGTRTSHGLTPAGAGWLRTVTETLLDAAGEPTAEFTRQVIDGAGRLLRLERPAADDPANIAVTAYYHDSAGRLCREVDPDGIVTLHTYDARGQHETTAIDTDRNDRIDYAGADRIQRRRVGYASRQHNGATLAVRRNTIESWEEAGSAAPTLVARDDVALAVPLAWQARHGLETRVEIATDRATASTVTQEFHPDGTRTETTVAAGLRTGERLFDCDGNLLSAMTFAYDTRRLRVAAIDDQGRASWHSHYSDGRLKSVTTADPDPAAGGPGEDPLTTTFSHGLAADGGQITVTSSAGRPDLVERYLPTGELALRHGGDAVPERCQYDHAGRLLALTTYTSFDPAAPEQGGTTTTWQYNAAGLPVAKTFADGKGPRQGYTAAGRLRERILAREHPDGGALSLLFRYDFDDADSASHAGDIVSVTYDDPSAWPAISYACRRDGSTSSVTDAAGRRRFSHAAGRVQAEQYETGPLAGFRVARTSDAAGRLSATILSHSGTVIHEVACAYTDGDGMPRGRLQAVSAGGLHWRYTFADGAGPVARVDFLDASGTPLLTHAISHDQLDRPRALELRPPGGATLLARAWRHDAAGRLHSDTDTSGRYWQFEYDMGGRLAVARRHASDGATLPGYAREYAWDASGNRTTSTVDGRTSLWQADPAGLNQLAARTVPRAVDIHGRVAAGAGITVELDDQAAIRTGDVFHAAVDCAPAGCTYPDDSDPPRRMYVGVEAARADGARARAGGFAELPPHPQHFLHDADGNLTDDGLWRYHWDAENRLVMQERTPAAVAAGMPPERICHAYDSNGRRFERADWIRNDAEGTYAVRAVRHFLYDGWHLLYERIWQETTACAFDFRSLPVEQDAGAQPVAYASDGRDLLLPADAALIWRQLNIHAQSVLAFDLDVTDGTALLAVGVRDTTGSDRCFVLGGDWDERAGAVADFSYWRDDLPAGWRHYRIPLGQHLPTGAVLGVRVLTGAPVRLRDMRLLGPAEATETTYVWGLDVSGTLGGAGGIGGLLAIEDRGSGRIFLPCADAAGNVLALVDRASRAVVAEYAYDPFGVPLRRTGPDADACPIGFASRYTDAPTGLVNFGYRYYHPALSRWLNRDPLGEAGGANLYAFAGNAPGNRLDPLGLTDFYVFSGIRASRNTPATNYLQILAHQVRLPPPANASYTNQDQLNAAVSGHPSRSDLIAFPQLMLPNSGLKLDSEARAKAAQQFNRGAFCTGSAPRRIHIIMLGPKTIQGNPSSGCCQVSIDTLYDPGDMVWNGAPQRGYTRNWAAIANGGTASAVRLHGANRHGLPPDLGDLQPLHQVTYMAASGSRRDILAPRTFWEPDPARPPLNITDITRRALQGGQYDIVALCHSQGCNIALHTFARACCAD
jgi:RHS repeat-associated protein